VQTGFSLGHFGSGAAKRRHSMCYVNYKKYKTKRAIIPKRAAPWERPYFQLSGILYVLPFSRYCRSSEALWVIGQNAQIVSPYRPNSSASEPNFTKRGRKVA